MRVSIRHSYQTASAQPISKRTPSCAMCIPWSTTKMKALWNITHLPPQSKASEARLS